MDEFIESEKYWKLKGYGRLLLLLSIGVYGAGLVLKRVHAEKREAEGDR